MSAEEKLSRARIQLMISRPFFGHLAMCMPLIESESAGGQRTTAVDAQGRFYYNKEWIENMPLQDVMFELGHEVMHLVQQCMARFPTGGDHATWNLAADYIVDTILVEAGFTQSAISKKMVPPTVQAKAKNNTTENLYYSMLKKGGGGGGGGKTPQMPGKGDPGPKPDPNGIHKDNIRGCVAASQVKDADLETIEKWKGHILAAAQISKGNVPGAIGDFLAELTKPSVTWKDILRHAASSVFKGRYSFNRPSRRSAAIGMRLPSRAPTKQGAVIFIDTSGSISDESLNQFVTECVQIMKECGAPWLHVFFHDVKCYHHEEYSRETIKRIKVTRGGTSHVDVFDKCNEVFNDKNKPIGMVIAFTDLFTSFPNETPTYPVYWGVVPEGMGQGVPFGNKVEVDLND